jgi:hypothetical protein
MYSTQVFLLWMGLMASPDERSGVLEATLKTTSGAPRALSEYRGKPMVLFYEDRDSGKLNLELKTQLFARARERNLLSAAWVVPVANLASYDWVPARSFATAGVKAAEIEAGVPILIDWEARLSKPPWGLPAKTSSVLLFDASGTVVFECRGRLSANELTEFFRALERLVQ